MTSLTDEPAVLAWRIALAPRPRFSTGGRHWWREYVVDAFRTASHAWDLEAEAASVGYETELREFAEQKPRPQFKHFLTHLSAGRHGPEGSGLAL